MKKSSIVKATLCAGAAVAIIANVSVPKASSATLCAEKGLAGISITLDNYCSTEDAVEMLEATEVPSEVVVATSAAVVESSPYDNVGISTASQFVNIRAEASTDTEVVGKLYRGAAADILSREGEWIKIKSGRCTGYINSSYLATGLKAEELAEKYGTKTATVNTTTLKVREKKSVDSACVTLVPNGETFEVISEDDEWVKISIDNGDIKGYVSKDYVDIDMELKHAISVEEEQEAIRKEEERKAAEEAARRAAEEAARQNSTTNSSNNSNNSNSSNSSNSSSSSSSNKNSKPSNNTAETPVVKGSGTGADIASYALQFLGNPYVYGGTSLTNGTDCSGFTMSVYAHFGVSLNRTSAAQSQQGKKVSLSEAQPGDLVFYASGGRVSHVAIYIGGGQVVHASSPKYGIRTSSVNYRTVYCVKRILK